MMFILKARKQRYEGRDRFESRIRSTVYVPTMAVNEGFLKYMEEGLIKVFEEEFETFNDEEEFEDIGNLGVRVIETTHEHISSKQDKYCLIYIKKMTVKIKWLIPLLALMLIIGTIEAGSDHPWRVRKTKSITPKTKSTIERHPMNMKRFDKDSGTDSPHQYNFGTPDHLWGVKATKGVEPEAKSMVEKHPIHTEENGSEIDISSHHSYNTACRPGTKCRN
ncbi:hypothetical protein L1987_80865 [Smallanthus sonchifolius]|uniref:Uncharacterized protein n=1 Tax=Smallanthus sonchifolius TaxID=185202 RepID=A0ACB8YN76_9ASTR|nr:hypothetical protein L1987_80865 [Smallanthus sonchifolius]